MEFALARIRQYTIVQIVLDVVCRKGFLHNSSAELFFLLSNGVEELVDLYNPEDFEDVRTREAWSTVRMMLLSLSAVFKLHGGEWKEFEARWNVISQESRSKLLLLTTLVCVESARIYSSLWVGAPKEVAYRMSIISNIVTDAFVKNYSCPGTGEGCSNCVNCKIVSSSVRADVSPAIAGGSALSAWCSRIEVELNRVLVNG